MFFKSSSQDLFNHSRIHSNMAVEITTEEKDDLADMFKMLGVPLTPLGIGWQHIVTRQEYTNY